MLQTEIKDPNIDRWILCHATEEDKYWYYIHDNEDLYEYVKIFPTRLAARIEIQRNTEIRIETHETKAMLVRRTKRTVSLKIVKVKKPLIPK